MKWTEQTPSADGWYWWRRNPLAGAHGETVVAVEGKKVWLAGVSSPSALVTLGGVWAGPLLPPEEPSHEPA